MNIEQEFLNIGLLITLAVIVVIAIYSHPDDTTKY